MNADNFTKPSVINLMRLEAKSWDRQIESPTAWISISEPEGTNSIISNPILDNLPNLKISFWDLTKELKRSEEETLYPPTDDDAKKIVDFIVQNAGKNIIVNCAAGISRSGAVAQFCSDALGYKWLEFGKKRAVPNSLLYRKMIDYFVKTYIMQ